MTKVTKEMIDKKIIGTRYFYDELLTICVIELDTPNGPFKIIGESACVSAENYDRKEGEKYAYNNAYDKIWLLEGYRLKHEKHETKDEVKEKPLPTIDEDMIKKLIREQEKLIRKQEKSEPFKQPWNDRIIPKRSPWQWQSPWTLEQYPVTCNHAINIIAQLDAFGYIHPDTLNSGD